MMNDIKLSELIGKSVKTDYVTALEFIESNPDYSLLKFREITETIVANIAKAKQFVLKDKNLLKQIYNLLDRQLINKPLMDKLHKLRELGNSGVHKPLAGRENNDLFELRKRELIVSAKEAREIIVSVFEDVYMLLNSGEKVDCTELVSSGKQEYREILYNAHVLTCHSTKLKAGVISESKLDWHNMTMPQYNPPNKDKAHIKQLQMSAFSFYDAACEISANIGFHEDHEEVIKQRANNEALFRYARLVLYHRDFKTEPNIKSIARNRLMAAAKRDYAPAQALYGIYLYEEENYKEAKPYLLDAEEKGDITALRVLFYFYTDGYACTKDIIKGLNYLNQAIELGHPDSIATLGFAYYEGKVLDKDVVKAKELLNKSIKEGSSHGNRSLADIKNQESENKEKLAVIDAIRRISPPKKAPIKVKNKIKRNELCNCGSGVKFKKCCWLD